MRKYLGFVSARCMPAGAHDRHDRLCRHSSTYYAGKNSQGQKLLFSVDQTASGRKFDPFFTTMVDRCPATGNGITVEFSFMGFQIPIKNGKFSV